jgi:pyruvate,water dikinase
MFIYCPGQNTEINEALVGGKAKNLDILQKKGFNVPSWFALTSSVLQEYLKDIPLNDFDDICQKIEAFDFDRVLKEEIETTMHKQGMKGFYLAVRSSAAGEDSAELSFAGQFESFLYVAEEDLYNAIKKVWASAFSDRMRAYLRHNDMNPLEFKIAVIIQKMVDSEVSGVAFGVDPITGNRNSVVISAVYGLGEGLVSGYLDSDNFIVTENVISSTIVKKAKAVRHSKTKKGVETFDIDPALQEISSLTEEQVYEIAALVKQLNNLYLKPQDVEWGYVENKLYVLQSRPVTNLNKIPDQSEEKMLWDNSNIIESYSGVTTPLTFSFIQDVYTNVYIEFCRIMGVEEEIIQRNKNIFLMLGLINGRVYYNLYNWYKVLSLLPGYTLNAEFMEQMMGVEEKLEIPPSVIKSTKNPYLRLVILAKNLLTHLIRLNKNIKNFYVLLEETLSPFELADGERKNITDLKEDYIYFIDRLLTCWNPPIINDFYAMIFFGVLKKMIARWGLDEHQALQNDLLIGEGDVISVEPVKNICRLSNDICQIKHLREFIVDNSAEAVYKEIQKYPGIDQQVQSHIKKFGARCMNELKLETITYRQDPVKLAGLIKSYVARGPVDLDELNRKESLLREKAEKIINKKLKNRPLKRFIFYKVLKQTRERIKNRENLRFERTRVFDQIREIFINIGKNLYAENILEHPRDIFYLTKEEIFHYINGTAVTVDLKALIKLRKKEFAAFENKYTPDRFETRGIVYHTSSFCPQQVKQDKSQSNVLQGIACSPGVVRARIRIVKRIEDAHDLNGCILVAQRTDPGWVPLFSIAEGILVERGSLLSHSAIVSREMGIPAIVGLKNLFELLIDGEFVEMNGTTGTVMLFRDHD